MENQLIMPGEMKTAIKPEQKAARSKPEAGSQKPETQKPQDQKTNPQVQNEAAQTTEDAENLQRANQTLEEIKKESQLLQKAAKAKEAFGTFVKIAEKAGPLIKKNPDMAAFLGFLLVANLNHFLQLAPHGMVSSMIDMAPSVIGGAGMGKELRPVSRIAEKVKPDSSDVHTENNGHKKVHPALKAADIAVGAAASTGLTEGVEHFAHSGWLGTTVGILDDIPRFAAGLIARIGIKI